MKYCTGAPDGIWYSDVIKRGMELFMDIFELNRKLNMVAELQKEFPPDDALTVLIQEYVNEELSANDLEWVSAAGIRPDYQAFLKLLDEKKRR